MTSVHTEPHRLAQKYVKPSSTEILKKYGIVRVEDWDDRVSGDVWTTLREQGNGDVERYVELVHQMGTSVLAPLSIFQVVRCHLQSTGDVVLLHDEWLTEAQVIA